MPLLRREEERRKQRFATRIAFISLTILVVISFFTHAYLREDDAKKVASSQKLAANAKLYVESRLDLASLLSIEAYQTSPTAEAKAALLAANQANPGLITYLHHGSIVNSVAFNPRDNTLAAAGSDGTVTVWNTATHQMLGERLRPDADLGHRNPHIGSRVAYSPDGRILASANQDEKIRLWDAATHARLGESLRTNMYEVLSVAFSPDGTMLAAGGEHELDYSLELWGVKNHTLLGNPIPEKGDVLGLAFSPDGRMLASLTNSTLQVLEVATRRPLGEPIENIVPAGSGVVAFSREGSMLATSGVDVRLWDASTRRLIDTPLKGHSNYVAALALTPDGERVVFGSDRGLRSWDVSKRFTFDNPLPGYSGRPSFIAFSRDGKIIALPGEDSVTLWDPTVLLPLGERLSDHEGTALSAAFSCDRKTLVLAYGNQPIELWDFQSRTMLGILPSNESEVLSIAISQDGKTLASVNNNQTVQLWDLATRRASGSPLPSRPTDPTRFIMQGIQSSIAFSPNGKILAWANQGRFVRLWDVKSRSLLWELEGKENQVSVAFSPDNRTLAAGGSDGSIQLWNVEKRSHLGDPLPGPREIVFSLAFSPNGKLLASGGTSNRLRVWDLDARRPVVDSQGINLVSSIVFSPDGNTLASATWGSIDLWDIRQLKSTGSLLGVEGFVSSLGFSADGSTLSSTDGGHVTLWDVNPQSWIARACRRSNRNLCASELQYVGENVTHTKTCDYLPPCR
jgi:WD40 repeat protein